MTGRNAIPGALLLREPRHAAVLGLGAAAGLLTGARDVLQGSHAMLPLGPHGFGSDDRAILPQETSPAHSRPSLGRGLTTIAVTTSPVCSPYETHKSAMFMLAVLQDRQVTGNRVYQVLEVSFCEDGSRIREDFNVVNVLFVNGLHLTFVRCDRVSVVSRMCSSELILTTALLDKMSRG